MFKFPQQALQKDTARISVSKKHSRKEHFFVTVHFPGPEMFK